MSDLQRVVSICHQLYKIRDTARDCYGERYSAQVQPFKEYVEAVAKGKGIGILAAGQEMAKELMDQGRSPMMVLAATVDLLDPVPEVPVVDRAPALRLPARRRS